MIYFIMVLVILICLIAYMAFLKAKHLINRVTTRIQEGAGSPDLVLDREGLVWIQMLLIKIMMFCVMGFVLAAALSVAQ